MKIKKSLVKVIVVGSIFFISSMSFGGLISLQDDNLNAFWSVSKLDTSFISTTYAESGGGESGGSWSYQKESGGYEKESGDYKRNVKTNTVTGASSTGIENTTKNIENTDKNIIEIPKPTISEPIVAERKKIELTIADKEAIKVKFEKLKFTLDEKYASSEQKLDVYNRLAFLVDKNISTLTKVKSYVTDEALLDKYEKKILLFKELSILTHETILAYVDNIDLVGNINIISDISSNIDNTKFSNTSTNNNNDAETRAAEAERLAKIEADRIAAEKARIAAEKESQARAAEAERLVKIEADRVAAAQAAAQATTTTHTSAS